MRGHASQPKKQTTIKIAIHVQAPYQDEPSRSSSLSVPAYHFDASSALNKLRPVANMTEHSRRHFQSLVSLGMHLD